MANSSSTRRKVTVWSGFALLCLMTSLEWVIPPAMTEVPTLQRSGLIDAVIGFAACAVAVVHKRDRFRTGALGRAALAGILFLGVPAILLDLVNGLTSSTTISLLFTITPVVVVITVMSSSPELSEGNELQKLLLPALAGVGGVLSIFPFSFPDSGGGWTGFAVVLIAVSLSGAAGVWLHRLLQRTRMAAAIAIIGISNAFLLLVWCSLRGSAVWRISQFFQGESIAAGFVQAVTFLLTLWLVREMNPVRLSGRYLVIPLLTIGEGLVTMRPPVTPRLIVGIVLLATGAWWILTSQPWREERPLSLR